MEFQRHLEELQEASREESGHEKPPDLSEMKVAVNELLFRFMPPTTTIADVDDFALAVVMTIQGAWQQ